MAPLAEDLGTWPAEQATVLVEVLQQAGITPQARRTREGVEVSVDESDADQAHATLVANMDTIARAARPRPGEGGRRRARKATSTPPTRQRASAERPMASQGMLRYARPLAILVVGLMVAAAPLPLPVRALVLIGAVLGMVWLLGRDADDGDGGR